MRFVLTLTCVLVLIVGVGTSRAEAPRKQLSANVQTHIFKKNLHKSETVVRWWNNKGRWALFSNHDKCWEIIGKKAYSVCTYARAHLRAHGKRAERLKAFFAPPPIYGMMNPICQSSCISCESGWNPMAWNPYGYWGLYQFDYSTWVAHGGDPSIYGKADASTQHLIASRITYDAWPNC